MILRPTPTVLGHLARASLSSRTTVACSSAVLRHSRHLATAVSPVRPTSPIQPPSKELNEPQIPYAFQEPPVRSPTHNIPVATLHLRSHHVDRLRLFLHFALHAAYAMNIPCTHPTYLPTKRSLITVVKSPFIFKKTQENFEEKVHKRLVKIYDTHPLVLSQWLQYLQANAMAGVGIK
ncbi:mitochondrial 37S ribosomal protein rsm10, partial [Tulasnella sp. 403]